MSIPLKLLLLEDDPFDAEINIATLEEAGYLCEWERVQTKKEFLNALKTPNYEIILIDYNLPAFDGMTALQLLKEHNFDIPALFVTGNLQAELAIDSIKTGATDFVHKDRLKRLAPSVARALEEALLRRINQEKEATLTFFNELNQFANQGATLEELAHFLARELPSILSCSSVLVHLRDEKHNQLLVYTPIGQHTKIEKELGISIAELKIPLDSDTIYATTASGKKEKILSSPEEIQKLIQEYIDLAPFSKKEKEELSASLPILVSNTQYKKIHFLPVLSGDRTIGLLELSYRNKDQSTDQERIVPILEQISAIFSRKLAEEETKQTRDELARLYRASGALLASSSPSLGDLARRIVETVLFEFEHSNCSLILTKNDSLLLERVAVAGTYAKKVSHSTLKINGQGLVPEVIRKGIIINSPNVKLRENYQPNWEAAHSEMAVPLRAAEKIIGAIDVQSPEKNAFSPDDQRLLIAFAERAALAIENVRLYEDAKRRLNRLGALHTIDVAIAKSVDNNKTVEVIAEQAQKQLKVDAVSILVKNQLSQSFQCLARQGFNTNALLFTNLAAGEGLAGQVALKRQIIRIDNLAEKNPFAETSELADENFISYRGVPLVSKDEVNGVLEIFHRSPLLPNAEWESFLNTLAGQAAIAIDNASLFDNLQKSNEQLRLAYDATLEGWARALELRDMETEGHSRRVIALTEELARVIGIKGEELEHIRRGSLLHDIGKMGIPDAILYKPGALSDDEWAIMQQHTIYAYDMLKSIPFLLPALGIPRNHHERWDGSGYPDKLSGEAIPLGARIFAVIDVFDALTNERPYRKEIWSREKTLAHIKKGAGTHFDPKIVEAFTKVISEKDWGE
ncbi:MAG: GAF domain-containing protein [Chloroflexi bacterium]|nr:GAF domain-containing protein [Chloroflexota bacterium]